MELILLYYNYVTASVTNNLRKSIYNLECSFYFMPLPIYHRHTDTCSHVHTHVWACIHTAHTYTHTCTHTCTHTYTHTHTHTHLEPGSKDLVQVQALPYALHDVYLVVGLQDRPLNLPGLHHMIRHRGSAIGHLISQANDVLPCPPWGGWQHEHTHTHSTQTHSCGS